MECCHGPTEFDVGAGFDSGSEKQRVENGPTRGIQGVDPELGPDGKGERLAAVGERHGGDGGSGSLDETGQEAGACQLDRAGAHHDVSRERVGGRTGPVDDQDSVTGPGEMKCGHRPRHAGANDDDIEIGSHVSLPGGLQGAQADA
jgi:hypothetical protein